MNSPAMTGGTNASNGMISWKSHLFPKHRGRPRVKTPMRQWFQIKGKLCSLSDQ